MVIFRRKNKNKQVERTFQKNRFFSVPKKINFKLGDSLIISLKEARIELLHIGKMKRLLRKLLTKRMSGWYSIREKIWYYGKTYFYLQKKSKNSRMGKGKGTADRKVLRIKKNFVLFECKGMSLYKLKWFVNKINKKLNFKFSFFFKKLILKTNWFNKKTYSFYYKKYLLN